MIPPQNNQIIGNDKKTYTIDDSVKQRKSDAIYGQRLRIEKKDGKNFIVADSYITKLFRTAFGKTDYLSTSELRTNFDFRNLEIKGSNQKTKNLKAFSEIVATKLLIHGDRAFLNNFDDSIKVNLAKSLKLQKRDTDTALTNFFIKKISHPGGRPNIQKISNELIAIAHGIDPATRKKLDLEGEFNAFKHEVADDTAEQIGYFFTKHMPMPNLPTFAPQEDTEPARKEFVLSQIKENWAEMELRVRLKDHDDDTLHRLDARYQVKTNGEITTKTLPTGTEKQKIIDSIVTKLMTKESSETKLIMIPKKSTTPAKEAPDRKIMGDKEDEFELLLRTYYENIRNANVKDTNATGSRGREYQESIEAEWNKLAKFAEKHPEFKARLPEQYI